MPKYKVLHAVLCKDVARKRGDILDLTEDEAVAVGLDILEVVPEVVVAEAGEAKTEEVAKAPADEAKTETATDAAQGASEEAAAEGAGAKAPADEAKDS